MVLETLKKKKCNQVEGEILRASLFTWFLHFVCENQLTYIYAAHIHTSSQQRTYKRVYNAKNPISWKVACGYLSKVIMSLKRNTLYSTIQIIMMQCGIMKKEVAWI